jgi:hypothetical protein
MFLFLAVPGSGGAQQVRTGPWGSLELTRIVLFAPVMALPGDASSVYPTRWFFRGKDGATLPDHLASFAFTDEQRMSLLDPARWVEDDEGITVTPDDALVFSLAPEVRSTLYTELGQDIRNPQHRVPWTVRVNEWDVVLAASGLDDASKERLERVVYRVGERFAVADMPALINQARSWAERQQLYRFQHAAVGYRVRVRVGSEAERAAVFDYWGQDGRLEEIRPIVEALGRTGTDPAMDISHVLTGFARERLNRYPDEGGLPQDYRQDCHWTSLNFFEAEPVSAWGTKAGMEAEIRASYVPVDGAEQLGDLVYLLKPDGEIIHAAVYLAANLVFTKNGDQLNQPWVIMDLDNLREFYEIAVRAPLTTIVRRHRLR